MTGMGAATFLSIGLLLPVVATADDTPAVALAPGAVHSGQLAPGEVAVYAAMLRADDFLHVLIEQNEIDLVVTVTGPAGSTMAEIDHPFGRDAPEFAALVAMQNGPYRLAVRPFSGATRAGHYSLRVAAWRPARPEDRLHAAAAATTNAAHRRADRRTADDLRAAAAGYRAASLQWQRLGDRSQEARVVRRYGQLQRRLGDDEAALATLQKALTLERTARHPAGVAAVLNEIGRVHRDRGENPEAVARYREALAILQTVDDAAKEATVRSNLGTALLAMGELRQALPAYDQALAIFRRTGKRSGEVTTLINLGQLHSRLGALDRAVSAYQEALPLAKGLARRDLVADIHNNLGITLSQLGELHAALESFAAALEVYREMGDPHRQAASLNSQGSLLLALGLPDAAVERLREAAALLVENDDPYLEGQVFLSLGTAARDHGDLDRAFALLERALALQRRTGDRDGEAQALYLQATVRQRSGQAPAACDLALQALAIFRAVGNARGEAQAQRIFGQSTAARGRVDEARRALTQAAGRAEAIDDVTELAQSQRELGRLERDAGNPQRALLHLEKALDLLESLRATIAGAPLRASHFATVRETYELAIDALMQRHHAQPTGGFDRRAFLLSERARARGLLDVRGRARVEGHGDPQLQARAVQLRRQLNALALQRRWTDKTGGDRAAADTPNDGTLEAQIAGLTAEYRLLEARLTPPLASGVRGFAISAHNVEEMVALLDHDTLFDQDTVLLEITLAEPRSYLWMVTREALTSVVLPGRQKIEAAAERLHQHLGQATGDRTDGQAAREALSQMVLAPAWDHLRRQRWVIVPDGALHYVPFAALPVPRQRGAAAGSEQVPLMVEHEVVHLPSLAVLAALRRSPRQPASGRLAILADPIYDHGDPRLRTAGNAPEEISHGPAKSQDGARALRSGTLGRLPWSGQEARTIATEAGSEGVLLATGFDASRALATSDTLGRYRAVHFAIHGVLDTQHPELSGLALSRFDATGAPQESFLRLHDIYPLRWQTELVVLSGCQTALGQAVRGEGLIGLAHGFLHAGAVQVVASLWPVRDRATAVLMERFYRARFRHDQTPAAALRTAQRAMWQERRWRDPYFWAGFILIGDWRAAGATP